jgi:probable phosphoglycerate mutase
VEEEPGFAEMEFGAWDGLTFAEVAERDKAGLEAWMGQLDRAPEGGESFETVQARVLSALTRVREAHEGRTIVVVSHVTPIKILVSNAIGAPLDGVFRMELSPASVSVVSYYPEENGIPDRASLRLYNARPPGNDAFAAGATSW